MTSKQKNGISRRQFVKSGATAAAVASPALFKPTQALGASKPIKIGFVSPRTGPLAPFGQADDFVLASVRAAVKDGIMAGGKRRPIEIIAKDSQSNVNRCSEVANQLILRDEVDLIVASGAPDTTNPVADQAEANETPCITTNCPWQPYFFGRKGNPKKGFDWTYHFFWGLEDVISVFFNLWGSMPHKKVVGGLWPNDADGHAWSSAKFGFPPEFKKRGYQIIDSGRYSVLNDNFSNHIAAFKKAGVELVSGNQIPPDFATFWAQSAQQGFRPKIVTIGKALLFPAAVEALGDRGVGLSTEVWWSPFHPFKSGLNGATAAQYAAQYTEKTGRQWTQPLGYQHAMFEIAIDVLKRAKDVGSAKSIVEAIASTNYESLVGNVRWGNGPVKNVAKTALVGGQWVKGKKFKYDLLVVNNKTAPNIPTQAAFKPIV